MKTSKYFMFSIKAIVVLSFSFINFSCSHPFNGQKSFSSHEIDIEKWTKAIINIEGRPALNNSPEYKLMTEKWRNHEISTDEFSDWTSLFYLKIPRYAGTAIYLIHNSKHYLLTARHVVEETIPSTNPFTGVVDTTEQVFQKLLLIQNGSQVISVADENQSLLMNLNAGPSYLRPFIFSSKEVDIAIINLDNTTGGKEFLNTLNNRGYIPVTINDIDTACAINKSQKIMSFGFPADFFQVGKKNLPPAVYNWQSDILSLPVVSEGTISDEMPTNSWFSGNIFVYHGNSGGPIVSNNKLIGLVSRGVPELKQVSTPTGSYYINRHILFTKSSLILPLLLKLEERVTKGL